MPLRAPMATSRTHEDHEEATGYPPPTPRVLRDSHVSSIQISGPTDPRFKRLSVSSVLRRPGAKGHFHTGLPRSTWLELVSARVPAPSAPPTSAPVPGEPISAPPTAPAPA